jgi:hypothetical protein
MQAMFGRQGWAGIVARRVCAALAILALFLQLLVTSAHIHSEEMSAAAAPGRDAARTLPGPVTILAGDCIICLTAHIAGQSLVPAPLPLPRPVALGLSEPAYPAPLLLSFLPHRLPATRGPPIA